MIGEPSISLVIVLTSYCPSFESLWKCKLHVVINFQMNHPRVHRNPFSLALNEVCTFSHSLDFGNALGGWWEEFPRSHDLMRQKGRRWFSGVGGCVGIFRNTQKKRQGIGSSLHPAVWKSSSCVLEELSALPIVGRNWSKKQFEVKICPNIDF